ncbi:MAG: glycosyltransferase [Rhodoferax sp.]|nr:glycosyltransferase [Rhodoferax sp.]MCF8190623.1 glycosyltransferase [Polynucleobacter sp.]
MPLLISIIITSFNEGVYLDRLFQDLSSQDFDKNCYEILFLEAGNDSKERAIGKLGYSSSLLRYWHIPELSRTAALNFLVKESTGSLIVRLDARTHIDPDYLSKIYALSLRENVANIGGVQVPIGESEEQKKIALIMSHPLGLGGGRFRNRSYRGKVDSLYLGAFSRKYMPNQPWFDERLPKISEDSDLNFRIRQMGGEIILDSSIIAWHYPRESLKTFFRLCFNYGVGRALFLIKHRQFSAPRQLFPPCAFLIALSILGLGVIYPLLYSILFIFIFFYLAIIFFVSFRSRDEGFKDTFFLASGFVGCHFFWTIGLFYGLITYK